MKKLIILIITLFSTFQVFAQIPLNDNCIGLIDLGTAPTCLPDTFTNVLATASNIGADNNPTCFNSNVASHDVWFAFTCSDTSNRFRLNLNGVTANSIKNPEVAIYRGDCVFDGLSEYLCIKADLGENSLFIDMVDLTFGLTYYIRVSDYSATAAPNWGKFTLCIEAIPPVSLIDEQGSTLCEGILADSGGEMGDYSSNEDHVFTICPNSLTQCIKFTLDYYNFDYAGGFGGNGDDYLAFYDSDTDDDSQLITQLNGANGVAGGGGVCFTATASSGCMTVKFHSDFAVQFEGFLGHWECSPDACPQTASISIKDSVANVDLVNAVATPFTTVSITNIDCPNDGYGTFEFATDNNELGLKKGLLLTSGAASLAVGPNDFLNASAAQNDNSDPDLQYLSDQQGNGSATKDACILEMDVFVATDELSFEYVFGSEEYPEFANDDYNDIFAFLVSGPGIVGDPNLTNSAKNIAVLPGTNQPVQINSVNNTVNWEYFRNNENGVALRYDGLTSDKLGIKKSLTARTAVVPCQTYHLKLAVADRFDQVYDSGVFVSEIKGGTPNLAVNFASGIDYFIEDCSGNQDQLIISLNEPLENDLSFNTEVSGSATLGLDYLMTLPPTITFPAGQTVLSFPIVPISDGLNEGTETIVITLTNDFGCGTVIYKSLNVDIKDDAEVNINGGADTAFVCAGGTLQLEATGATTYIWQPINAVSNPDIGNPTISPTQNIWLEVTGFVGTCVDADSVYVKIVDPVVDVTALDPVKICVGQSVRLKETDNVGNSGLVWTPALGLDDPNSPTPTATPTQTTTYYASVTIAGCTRYDSVIITVDTLFFPTLIADTTVCQNYPVQLAESLNGTTTYSWTPGAGLDNPNVSGPIATPDVTTIYLLTAKSANNHCSQTGSVKVTVIASDVDIAGPTYREICLGEKPILTATANPAGSQITWTPAWPLNTTTGNTVTVNTDETVTIIARYSINNCVAFDSVRIRVDSLPTNKIMRSPDKAIYCPGDTVVLFSKTYEPADFPDIMFKWEPYGGQVTPDSLWNMAIRATLTHTFVRIESNHACHDTSKVEVVVGVPPTITITAADPTLCPGASTQLTVTADPAGTKIEWDESPSISCTDCYNPTVNPSVTTTYSLKTPESSCPSGASIEIAVLPLPDLSLPSNPTICLGDNIKLNTINEPGTTYLWTAVPATIGFPSTAATPTTAPTVNTKFTVEAVSPQGCGKVAEVDVTVASANVDAGANQSVCENTQFTLTATPVGNADNPTFTWEPTGSVGSVVTLPALATATFKVNMFYSAANCLATDTVKITVIAAPDIDSLIIIPDSSAVCEGTPIQLRAVTTPANVTYEWKRKVGDSEETLTSTTNTINNDQSGASNGQTVRYSVVATNGNGCKSAESSVDFNVIRCWAVPNIFTPGNGDDVNNTFGLVLQGGELELESFRVYSRWGEKVFEATETLKRWDGKINDKDAPSDVYVFYMKFVYPDGSTEEVKGDVTLLR